MHLKSNPRLKVICKILFFSLLILASSCAFEPGEPWGYIESSISLDETHLQAPPGITITSVEITTTALRIYDSSSAPSAARFDPANPPPGYSLCHGGHCHADDGSLPTYAEIEALLSGDTATKSLAATARFNKKLSATHELESDLKILQRGMLLSAEIEFSALHIKAIAKRDDEPLPLTIHIPLNSTRLSSPIQIPIDRDSPPHQHLELIVELPHNLLANIDPDELTTQPDGSFLIDEKNNQTQTATIASIFEQNTEIIVHDDHDHDDHDHDDHDH